MMNSHGFDNESRHSQPMAEINTTPMVDVMLVLLVIFIITAPLLTHSIKIELPQAGSQSNSETPETLTVSIDAQGTLFWNDRAITATDLTARLATAAQQTPQPELQLRADGQTPYQRLANVLAEAQSAGITKIGFITAPQPKP